MPTKEAQVRCICDLDAEQQIDVAHEVFEVVGDREAGAKEFMEAREKLYPKPKLAAKESKPADALSTNDAKVVSKVVSIQFDTKLVSLAELKKRADYIYNIYANPLKRQEALKVINTLKCDLELWADWQANQLSEKEAK